MGKDKYLIRIHTSREGANALQNAMKNFVLDEVGTFPVDLNHKDAWWNNPDSETAKVYKKAIKEMNKKNKKYKKYSKQ